MLWFMQRLLVLVLTSLPDSFVLVSPSSAAFGFGLGSLALEMLTRRVRHLGACMAWRPSLQFVQWHGELDALRPPRAAC